MAVVPRFSCCLLAQPKNSSRSAPYDQISVKSNLSGKLPSFPYKVEKLVFSFRNGLNELLDQPCIAEHKMSGMMRDVRLRFPAMELLVGNALIFTTPLKALAETCEADNSGFSMPVLLFVALVGATVGGKNVSGFNQHQGLAYEDVISLVARQRKGELQRVNEQLRQINASLRRQAKIESYAPTLSYSPIGAKILPENEVIVDPRKHELISRLKAGKNFLRNQETEKALDEFKAALELAQTVKDPIEEKKAARGLGASLQRLGKHREAIKYHSMVLEISEREGEDSGNTEAFGAIADCYTELGDLERAGKFYDNYIARLESD